MGEVKINFDDNGFGAFLVYEGSKQMGEMAVSVTGNELTVHHTEVLPEAEGKGLAKELLKSMAEYSRNHNLKVIPLCAYVHVQFKRYSEAYADIWKKERSEE